MRSPKLILMFIAIVAVVTMVPVHAAESGEWTLLSSYVSGDYGTDTVSDTGSMTVRYAVGSNLQFSIDLPFVSTEFSYGVVNTGVGTIPLGPDEEDSRRQGNGNVNEPSGPGESGFSPAVLAAVTESENTSGIGDVRVRLYKKLGGGGVKLYRFDAGLEVKVPTADETAGLGTGEADYRLGLAWDYRLWSAKVFAGGGYNLLGDPWWGDLNDVLDVYAGIEGDPIAGERLMFSGWVSGNQETLDGIGQQIAAGVGLRTTGRVRWYADVIKGLSDASPDLTARVGVSFGLDSSGDPQWRGTR